MLKYDRNLQRVWIAGKRIHHGFIGASITLVGAILMYHDRHDWPWPFNDLQNDKLEKNK